MKKLDRSSWASAAAEAFMLNNYGFFAVDTPYKLINKAGPDGKTTLFKMMVPLLECGDLDARYVQRELVKVFSQMLPPGVTLVKPGADRYSQVDLFAYAKSFMRADPSVENGSMEFRLGAVHPVPAPIDLQPAAMQKFDPAAYRANAGKALEAAKLLDKQLHRLTYRFGHVETIERMPVEVWTAVRPWWVTPEEMKKLSESYGTHHLSVNYGHVLNLTTHDDIERYSKVFPVFLRRRYAVDAFARFHASEVEELAQAALTLHNFAK